MKPENPTTPTQTFHSIKEVEHHAKTRMEKALADLFFTVYLSPKPIVARVHGAALGGEFNVGSNGSQQPDVAVAPDGSFVITWTGAQPGGGGDSMDTRKYLAEA